MLKLHYTPNYDVTPSEWVAAIVAQIILDNTDDESDDRNMHGGIAKALLAIGNREALRALAAKGCTPVEYEVDVDTCPHGVVASSPCEDCEKERLEKGCTCHLLDPAAEGPCPVCLAMAMREMPAQPAPTDAEMDEMASYFSQHDPTSYEEDESEAHAPTGDARSRDMGEPDDRWEKKLLRRSAE